jgi:hypothetical protein
MSILVGSLTKFVKLYNCIISLRTWFFSFNKSTFRSPVTTTCWVKLNDCTIRDRDKPWFNSGIKREVKIRDSLHKKMRKQPNINNICKYKVQRNKVNNMIIHAKQQFFLNSNDFLYLKFP